MGETYKYPYEGPIHGRIYIFEEGVTDGLPVSVFPCCITVVFLQTETRGRIISVTLGFG